MSYFRDVIALSSQPIRKPPPRAAVNQEPYGAVTRTASILSSAMTAWA
jgi:hypothetical protein